MTEQLIKKINIQVLLIVHLAIIILTLATLLFSPILQISQTSILGLWNFIAIVSFVWIVWSWYIIKRNLFNPYGIFLLAAFLFNLSIVLLSLIPGNESVSLTRLFPTDVVILTVIVVDLSFLGLHLGALISTIIISKQKTKPGLEITDKDLIVVGYFLILISLYPLYLTTRDSINLSINFGYNSLYRQSLGTGVLAGPSVLANFIVPGVLFVLAGSKKNKANLLISLLIITSYTSSQLILGKRSIAIMPLIAYVWLWHKLIKPVRIGLISTMSAIFLFLIFPAIRLSRNIAGTTRFSWQSLTDLFATTNPFLDVLNEMGLTMQTIAHTIQIIPEYRHFDWGVSYLYALTTAIPNLFWHTHPVIVHGTLSSWLISIVDPRFARLGGSLGYSFIAEAYANFGVYGSMAIILLIGFLFVLFSEFVEKTNNRAYLVALASYLSFFIFFARSESSSIIRPLIWYSLIPLALCVLASRIRKKNV